MENKDTLLTAQNGIATTDAAEAFAALGSEARLSILRTLVRAGPEGLPVGALQDRLGLAASTLSHHLKALVQAGLLTRTREGTVLRCTANYDHISALAAFLIEECCADEGADAPSELETAS